MSRECVCGSPILDPDNCERCALLSKIDELVERNGRLEEELKAYYNSEEQTQEEVRRITEGISLIRDKGGEQ